MVKHLKNLKMASSFSFSMIRRVDALYRMTCLLYVFFSSYHKFRENTRKNAIAISGRL